MLGIAKLTVIVGYLGYAAVVYRRLRTGSELQAEIAETRSWVRCTPPWHLFADLLLPAMPLIAELACVLNGLLWPVEMLTRPWRSREAGVVPASKPSVAPVPDEDRLACLDALAAKMKARGWVAYVAAARWRAPRLFVQHSSRSAVSDTVLAAPGDATDERRYRFAHAACIAPAAEAVICALSRGTDCAAESGLAAARPAPLSAELLAEGRRR